MRFRCNSCGELPYLFEFEADTPTCPLCGRNGPPLIARLADVHFMVLGSGHIRGPAGRQHVACQPQRQHLGLTHEEQFSASDDPRAVTCRSCKGTKAYQELAKLFPEIELRERMQAQIQQQAIVQRGFKIEDSDCCG